MGVAIVRYLADKSRKGGARMGTEVGLLKDEKSQATDCRSGAQPQTPLLEMQLELQPHLQTQPPQHSDSFSSKQN